MLREKGGVSLEPAMQREHYSHLTLCLLWSCCMAAKQEVEDTYHYEEDDQNTDQL